MGFRKIRFFNYRNIIDAEVEIDAAQVFLVGNNAQGKTNFIEAVYLVCYGTSFRTKLDGRMIRMGCDTALVDALYQDESAFGREVTVKLSTRGKKEVRVDSNLVRDRKQLVEASPCIAFSHADMELVTGPPSTRRQFLNQTISLLDPLFIDLLRHYSRILRARNIILKEKNFDLLETYDQKLASFGWEIQQRRMGLVDSFNKTFIPLFRNISGMQDEMAIEYHPSWNGAASEHDAQERLERSIRQDEQSGTTTSGPHRDSIDFFQKNRRFSPIASTGQVRLLSLTLKTAQARYFNHITGKRPILLLDDVLLELDSAKKNSFLDSLPGHEQAFFTFLPDEKYIYYAKEDL